MQGGCAAWTGPASRPQWGMINGVSPTPHQLAGDIWYLSLQDRIDFWEIMQKMNCHGAEAHRTKGGDTFFVQHRNQAWEAGSEPTRFVSSWEEKPCCALRKCSSQLLLWKWVSARILRHTERLLCLVRPHNGFIISLCMQIKLLRWQLGLFWDSVNGSSQRDQDPNPNNWYSQRSKQALCWFCTMTAFKRIKTAYSKFHFSHEMFTDAFLIKVFYNFNAPPSVLLLFCQNDI